jgi:hypothetical protein
LRSVCKHGLPKTIEKILSVAGSLPVEELRAAVARNRRMWKSPPPEEVLLEFCRQMPGVQVDGRQVYSPLPHDWRQTLSGVEARLVQVLREHGPVMERGALEDLCVSGGMNRFSFHAFVASSPVIVQCGHSVYGLLGTKVSPEAVRALVARRRAERAPARVLDGFGRTDDGKVWLSYRFSKAASTYAVITVPAMLKDAIHGQFRLLSPTGQPVGTLTAKDGRAWGVGAFLRRWHAAAEARVTITLDLTHRNAIIAVEPLSF